MSSTACRSKVERLITLSTSAVAVCCCSRSSCAQLVEQAGVLDGDHGLAGEVRDQLDLLVGERPDLLAIDGDGADQLLSLSIGTKARASAGEFGERDERSPLR